jgi:exosortase/archaeosortase family protein
MAVHNRWVVFGLTFSGVLLRMRRWRATGAGVAAAGGGALLLSMVPQLRIDLFAAGAARLAASLLGAVLERGETATLMTLSDRTVAVTAACSGTDFFLMVAGLLGWRLAREDRSFVRIALTGLALALPVTLFVNALRLVVVIQAHRWVIPQLPERHGAFAHMITGAAVFLPSLIVLNLLLELYAKRHYAAFR